MDVTRRMRLLLLLSSLGIVLALILVACGATPPTPGAGRGPAASGGPKSAVTVTIGAGTATAPSPSLSGSAQVALLPGATHYVASDTIIITVQNTTGRTIYALTQFTGCSILSLQRRASGSWQPVQLCAGGFPHPRITPIAPGGKVAIQLAAASTSNDAGSAAMAQWPAGTYRAELTYTTSASEPFSHGTPAYSATFGIGE